MTGTASEGKQVTRSRHMPWLVTGVTLFILASAIVMMIWHLRAMLRAQIIQQDGIALFAASMVPGGTDLGEEFADDPVILFFELADKVIEASKSRRNEVLEAQIFNRDGNFEMDFNGGTERLTEEQLKLLRLTEEQLRRLKQFKTISTFEEKVSLREALGRDTDSEVPLLRTLVPLAREVKSEAEGTSEPEREFIGAAEFFLDGHKVQAILTKADRDLWFYGALIFFAGGGITAAALMGAFRRLQQANKLLAERTQSLLRANHDLTMSAKTSAIGAITAHLIHDLKSPLFGLQSFVSARGSADAEDWDVALDTTQRMQKVIAEIVRILQEEKTTEKYQLSIDEIFSLLRTKLAPQCEKAGLEYRSESNVDGSLINRDANIILLTITNIVQNAIQATPRGGVIEVKASSADGSILFEMRDTGPGLPKHILATLFTPSRSTKSGGTGLGMAISKQLANHIGAELVLKETSGSGTVFELRVPERVLLSELVEL